MSDEERNELEQLRDARNWSAIEHQANALRAEILERLRLQHQLIVVAGAVAAIAASVVFEKKATLQPGVLLGLSVLFLSFGFASVNHSLYIQAAGRFLESTTQSGPIMGARWHEWEKRSDPRFVHVGVLTGWSFMALPLGGALAAGGLYLSGSGEEFYLAGPGLMGIALFYANIVVHPKGWGWLLKLIRAPTL